MMQDVLNLTTNPGLPDPDSVFSSDASRVNIEISFEKKLWNLLLFLSFFLLKGTLPTHVQAQSQMGAGGWGGGLEGRSGGFG